MKALRHPRQWLSAALLAGLLIMAAASGLFVYLADEVGEQAWLASFDLAVAQFFNRHGVWWLARVFEAVTFFGNPSTITVIGLGVALLLATLRRWSLLAGWTAALIGTALLKHDTKSGGSTPASPAAGTVDHRDRLEFSERPRNGFVGRLRLFGLLAHANEPS